jgi:hypothetical protein
MSGRIHEADQDPDPLGVKFGVDADDVGQGVRNVFSRRKRGLIGISLHPAPRMLPMQDVKIATAGMNLAGDRSNARTALLLIMRSASAAKFVVDVPMQATLQQYAETQAFALAQNTPDMYRWNAKFLVGGVRIRIARQCNVRFDVECVVSSMIMQPGNANTKSVHAESTTWDRYT